MNLSELGRTEIERLIDEWIVGNNAIRDREIMKARLINGIRFEPLAEQFDMSVTQIKRIVHKGTETIFKHLEVK